MAKEQNRSSKKHLLTVFALAMINVSLIASLRGLPLMAEYGLSLIFFLLVGILIFLIPSSLVSAELATGWPKKGGVYIWVREAFGERWGFIAIWLQWVQNLVFYPTALAATAAVLAYLFHPDWADSKIFTLAVIIIVYWGATLINFRGMKTLSLLTTIGTITGILIPGALIVILALVWLALGYPSQITFDAKGLIPDFSNIKNIVFFSGVMLFFAGMEVSSVHAQEVKNPQKDYPKAIFLSVIIIIAIFVLGSLAVAVIVPQDQISLTAGIMETFSIIFTTFKMKWAIAALALLAAPGMIAQISTWIAGPSKGLLVTAENGDLPPFFQKVNKNGVQTHILIIQGIVVTILASIFLFMPSVSSSFWILTALTAQLYLTMYLLLFATAIKLRYSRADVPRAYRVPGGNFGMWLVAGIGILGALCAILLGFFPPSQLDTGGLFFYESFLIIGMIITIFAPIIIFALRKPSWKQNSNIQKED